MSIAHMKRFWHWLTICPVCGIIIDRFGRCGCNTNTRPDLHHDGVHRLTYLDGN